MITLFSIPKPFKGHISIIQRNAIQSWLQIHPNCEVILFGDDEGVREVAEEYGVRHIPNVQKNEYGTPILSDAFDIIHREAKNDIICYVNADIILIMELNKIDLTNKFKKFLIVGQRINLQVDFLIDYTSNGWKETLKTLELTQGVIHPGGGKDYFIFPRELIINMPPFAVGRPLWDDWMIYNANKQKIPIIDATMCITALHQNHNYLHIPNGDETTYEGPEAKANRSLVNEFISLSAADLNWYLTMDGVKWRLNIIRKINMTIRTIFHKFKFFCKYFVHNC
jgi:hypothetical protein